MPHADLVSAVLELSKSKNISEAYLEWEVSEVWIDDEWSECECGHRIKERCSIENKFSGGALVVGNCCVKLFGSEKLKVVRAVRRKKLSVVLIDYCWRKGIINVWQRSFSLDVFRKKSLSVKQQVKLEEITKLCFGWVGTKPNPL